MILNPLHKHGEDALVLHSEPQGLPGYDVHCTLDRPPGHHAVPTPKKNADDIPGEVVESFIDVETRRAENNRFLLRHSS